MFETQDKQIKKNIPNNEIINLNVGGQKFATSKQTLISVENTFFTSLLSHENDLISALKDHEGSFFIDRDPAIFRIILNYLRTGQLHNIDNISLDTLLHESEFYGIHPLVKRLKFCHSQINKTECSGSLLFQGMIKFDEDLNNPEYRLLGDNRDLHNAGSVKNHQLFSYDHNQVVQIVTDNYFVSVGYTYQIRFYKFSDTHGFRLLFEPYDLDYKIDTIAFYRQSQPDIGFTLYIGIYFEELKQIQLWCLVFNKDSLTYQKTMTSNFSLRDSIVNCLFFIGPHLVALSYENGLIGVSHAHNGQWLIQNLTENSKQLTISAYDKVGCDFLLLATNTGSIFMIDMDKFPLRIKDGGLLINELYNDPNKKMITSISCYLTTKTSFQPRAWFEIAYGTVDGTLRVLIPQIETGGMILRLFQTFKVHLNPIRSVMLSDKYLISLCDKMHVRTYSLIRFRDHISTQPGSDSYASFQIAALDNEAENSKLAKKRFGPFGHQIDGSKQIFIQRLSSDSNKINVLCASNGRRVCSINSVDKSTITTYAVLDEEIALGNRTKILFLTGHKNGNVQCWDLISAFELMNNKSEKQDSKLNYSELIKDVFE